MNNLSEHLHVFPANAHELLLNISGDYSFKLLVKKERQTKLGDYRFATGKSKPIITLNNDPNSYRVLITYLHELAHHIVWLEVGKMRNPHGSRWKKRFSQLLHIFGSQNIFPDPLNKAVEQHLLKPTASSHSDTNLITALRSFDPASDKLLLNDIAVNQLFTLNNGRVFKKGNVRRTRVLCEEIDSKKKYLIHKFAEVSTIE